ncbi:head-tail adaptor protein [Pseudokordiimonas caeni]|uniref:head-tail adaptor protein n=1 Tax=Pseudokordiimonas caeni TaxID=2997908 RepID=UPI00281113F1|nr:head-tail adaptor protein [Pseudokordiimonas caeni]
MTPQRLLIGHMGRRIILQSLAETVGAGGERAASWRDIAAVWARIETEKPSPADYGETRVGRTRATFTTHFAKSFRTARRLIMDGRVFEIDAIIEHDFDHKRLSFEASETGELIAEAAA